MRGRRTRRTMVGALVAMGVLALGCSADDAGDVGDDGEDAVTQADAGRADADGAGPAPTGAATGPDGEQATIESGGSVPEGLQLIREASIRLASDDPDATLAAIHRAASAVGGFVAGEDLHRRDGILQGSVTLRVPATELDGALGRIATTGAEVVDRQRSSRDVTLEVADVAAQLRNLRALETELLELLADARESGSTEQVLTVFDRVRGVREEIERLEGRRTTLADLVALSTVTVHIEPTAALLAATAAERDPEPSPWDPGRRVSRAWQATVDGTQTLVAVLIVVAVTALPLALLWGVPIGVVVLAVRRWRHRRATTPAAAPPPPTQSAHAGSVPSAPDVDED